MNTFRAVVSLFVVVVSFSTGGSFLLSPDDKSESTTKAVECQDTLEDCHHYHWEDICEGLYKPWATVRCAKYCGFCTASGTDESCVDKLPNCEQFRPCEDPVYFRWVADNCLKFCNRCGPAQRTPTSMQTTPRPTTVAVAVISTTGSAVRSTTSAQTTSLPITVAAASSTTVPPSSACQDNLSWCGIYSKSACQDTQWGLTYCPRFCDLCQLVSEGASTVGLLTTSTVPEGISTEGLLTTSTVPEGTSAEVLLTTSTVPAGTSAEGLLTTSTVPEGISAEGLLTTTTVSEETSTAGLLAISTVSEETSTAELLTSTTTVFEGTSATGLLTTTTSGETTEFFATLTNSDDSSASSSCQDQLSTCTTYSQQACTDAEWGRTYCANYCNLCEK